MSRKIRSRVVAVGLGALLFSPALFLGTACNPECVDKYDCKAKAHVGDAGLTDFQCVNATCKAVAPSVPTPDAGL